MGWDERGEGGQRGREEDRMERAEHTRPRVKRYMPYKNRERTRTTRAQLARPASSPGSEAAAVEVQDHGEEGVDQQGARAQGDEEHPEICPFTVRRRKALEAPRCRRSS